MISEEQALATILAKVRPLAPRTVPLLAAEGCYSSKVIRAGLPLPLFPNSSMDGYAVVASEATAGKRLRVIGEQPAGPDKHLAVGAEVAVRIFTGAPIPEGADAVIMQEDVRVEQETIVIADGVEAGENIRTRGCDLAEGQQIVAAGERLNIQTIALLAAQGRAELEIGGVPRTAILSTGDELVPPGAALGAGQIYESNSVLLQLLAAKHGAQVVFVRHERDDLQSLRRTIQNAADADVMLISGGVSVGDKDFVKPALRELGASTDIWRVSVKPGKPFLFGTLGNCLVFGLPGNPVSAFVTFLLFVRPALLRLMGASDAEMKPRSLPARLTVEVANPGDRPHYVRGRLAAGEFTPVGRQESHALSGLQRSNALLRVGAGSTLSAGHSVNVESFD